MESGDKFYVQQVGKHWTFGREGTAFETFPSEAAALERAEQFRRLHPDVAIIIVDSKGNERVT
jgi:hypothetical protein